MSLRFFGTDGIRGAYGGSNLNDAIAFRAGRAAVRVARRVYAEPQPRIVIGRDTRASGESLLAAFAKGVAAEGGLLANIGIAPTPCVAYATGKGDFQLGCAVTASHNPAADNGIKFFQSDGVKPSESLEQALDDEIGLVEAKDLAALEAIWTDAGEWLTRYADAIVAAFPERFLEGKRIALDCANGAMSQVAPEVFRRLGAQVDVVGAAPDGRNINAGVGSECPESLGALYREARYDLGFAFDGDGDRLIVSDESGTRIAGEGALAVLAIDLRTRSALPGNTLVTTVQSNLGLDAALEREGISVARTDVGDKHIARLMLEKGYRVGGEESGHVVLGGFAITGDGLFAAVQLADIEARSGVSISSLAGVYRAYPQKSTAVRVASKPPLASCPTISRCIREKEAELGKSGRLLVRYSGTEPKLRLLVEADSNEKVAAAMRDLRAAVDADLEVVS